MCDSFAGINGSAVLGIARRCDRNKALQAVAMGDVAIFKALLHMGFMYLGEHNIILTEVLKTNDARLLAAALSVNIFTCFVWQLEYVLHNEKTSPAIAQACYMYAIRRYNQQLDADPLPEALFVHGNWDLILRMFLTRQLKITETQLQFAMTQSWMTTHRVNILLFLQDNWHLIVRMLGTRQITISHNELQLAMKQSWCTPDRLHILRQFKTPQ